MNLKKLVGSAIVVGMVAGGAWAVPTLQLDITPGSYVGGTFENSINTGNQFDVIALLNDVSLINDNFYLSMAVTPNQIYNQSNPPDYGYFIIDGTKIDVTKSMVYGNAPIDTYVNGVPAGYQEQDNGDLNHGIYETYFTELKFNFNALQTVPSYNVKDEQPANGDLYKKSFAVDISGLNPTIGIHFDLYNEKVKQGSIGVDKVAPFSHDAEVHYIVSTPKNVPEPSLISLLGFGILGLGFIRRKMK